MPLAKCYLHTKTDVKCFDNTYDQQRVCCYAQLPIVVWDISSGLNIENIWLLRISCSEVRALPLIHCTDLKVLLTVVYIVSQYLHIQNGIQERCHHMPWLIEQAQKTCKEEKSIKLVFKCWTMAS